MLWIASPQHEINMTASIAVTNLTVNLQMSVTGRASPISSSAIYQSFYKITLCLENKKIAVKTRNTMEGRKVDQLIRLQLNIYEIPKSSNILLNGTEQYKSHSTCSSRKSVGWGAIFCLLCQSWDNFRFTSLKYLLLFRTYNAWNRLFVHKNAWLPFGLL